MRAHHPILVLFMTVLALASSVEARVYNPQLGRWLQRDPIGHRDGPSLYQYVEGRPIARIDSSGLASLPGSPGMTYPAASGCDLCSRPVGGTQPPADAQPEPPDPRSCSGDTDFIDQCILCCIVRQDQVPPEDRGFWLVACRNACIQKFLPAPNPYPGWGDPGTVGPWPAVCGPWVPANTPNAKVVSATRLRPGICSCQVRICQSWARQCITVNHPRPFVDTDTTCAQRLCDYQVVIGPSDNDSCDSACARMAAMQIPGCLQRIDPPPRPKE